MGRARGYILVLLVAIWATMPALASLCPRQLPPCCRGMRNACCAGGNGSALELCCHLQMPKAAATPAAVVNTTDHAWHEVSLAVLANTPALESLSFTHEPIRTEASPPHRLSLASSILRI